MLPKFWDPPPNLWHKNNIKLLTIFCDFVARHHISPERMSHWQTKVLASTDNVSFKSWPTFRDLWLRNGWDPFAHCDHVTRKGYTESAAIMLHWIVATCLVYYAIPSVQRHNNFTSSEFRKSTRSTMSFSLSVINIYCDTTVNPFAALPVGYFRQRK